MGRDDVPQQDVVLDAELLEHAVDDRRRRLGRPGARELAFGRERDAADASAAIAGGLADEDDPSSAMLGEIGLEAVSQQA